MDQPDGFPRVPDGRSATPAPEALEGLLGESLAARLERWAAAARVDYAAAQRSREQWMRQAAREEGSLAGVLMDLAERNVQVAVHARAGRVHHGRVQVVGRDFLGLAIDGPGDALVAQKAVSSLRVRPGEPVTVGDRQVRAQVSLRQVVVGLCAERERAMLVSHDGQSTVVGTLQAVGWDVATLRLGGDGGGPGHQGTAYVPLASVSEVILG